VAPLVAPLAMGSATRMSARPKWRISAALQRLVPFPWKLAGASPLACWTTGALCGYVSCANGIAAASAAASTVAVLFGVTLHPAWWAAAGLLALGGYFDRERGQLECGLRILEDGLRVEGDPRAGTVFRGTRWQSLASVRSMAARSLATGNILARGLRRRRPVASRSSCGSSQRVGAPAALSCRSESGSGAGGGSQAAGMQKSEKLGP
jgi:hypothetical protein